MSVIVAPNQTGPIKSYHQLHVTAAVSTALAPPAYVPVPVASALKGGTTGTAYAEMISAQGGTAPYAFSITGGALPSGLSMSSGGSITGTPSATGTSSFTVTVTDTNGYTGSQTFSIDVAAPASGGAQNFGMMS